MYRLEPNGGSGEVLHLLFSMVDAPAGEGDRQPFHTHQAGRITTEVRSNRVALATVFALWCCMPATMLRILSIDHDASHLGAASAIHHSVVAAFKLCMTDAAIAVAAGRTGFGMFLDDGLGSDALRRATDAGLWIARKYPVTPRVPTEVLATWPRRHVVKVMADARATALDPLARRLQDIIAVAGAAEVTGRELLLEALPADGQSTAELISRLHAAGIRPCWWLIEPPATLRDWGRIESEAHRSAACRGIVIIARSADVASTFSSARARPMVRGFVGGRSVFGPVLPRFLSGDFTTHDATRELARRFRDMAQSFEAAAASAGEPT